MTEYGCDAECQKIVEKGTAADRAVFGDVPFDTTFYETAKTFSAERSKPGDLLKLEPYINATSSWGLPPGATLYRFQYVSIGQDGKVVPATGSIVLPFVHRARTNSLPVVAWTHGTIGTHYGCAPSSSYNIFDYDAWIPLYTSGYAVVAPDYAGLGNNYTTHKYLASTLAAKDTYYGMVASKKAFGDLLSNKWATAGHSQGGGTVWALMESEYVTPGAPCANETSLEFVGGVALSPAPRVADLGRHRPREQNRGGLLLRLFRLRSPGSHPAGFRGGYHLARDEKPHSSRRRARSMLLDRRRAGFGVVRDRRRRLQQPDRTAALRTAPRFPGHIRSGAWGEDQGADAGGAF